MRRSFSSGGTIRKGGKRERMRAQPRVTVRDVHREVADRLVHAMPDIVAAQAAYDAQDWDQAAAMIERMIHGNDLRSPMAYDAWASCAQFQGRMDLAIDLFRKALAVDPDYRVAHDRLIMILDALPTTSAATAQRERTRWWERYGKHLYARRQPHANNRDPERPLRVGYVSGDYQYHSAATVFHRIIMNHSPGFIPYLYSSTPTKHVRAGDTVALGFMQHPNFRQLVDAKVNKAALAVVEQQHPQIRPVERINKAIEDAPWPDWLVAQKILEDKIDILVDLSGYTAHNRLPVFCMKPAPIQITGWGYATGVGWPAMDYLVTDRVVLPPHRAAEHDERPMYLPSVIDYEPTQGMPEANPLPCLTERPTFGVFQRSLKINAACLDVWRQILLRLPEARLLFKSHYCDTFKAWIVEQLGAVSAQVEFQGATSSYDHKVAYRQVDLNLDPWPQTAGVSGCDGLWQGVPMVTLVGDRIIQRTSASLLTTLGLTDFIAETPEQYIQTAVDWVTVRKQELAELRQGLRARCEQSPIQRGYLAAVETQYRDVWRAWCAEESAQRPLSPADALARLECA